MKRRYCNLKCEYAEEVAEEEIVGVYISNPIYCNKYDLIMKKGKLCLERKVKEVIKNE